LAKLADQLGVPTMVKPPNPYASLHQPHQDSPKPEARPSPTLKQKNPPTPKKLAPASTPSKTAFDKLTFEFPRYLIDAIKRDAIERHTTARHVLMLALQGAGFDIDAADLVPDARRRKTVKP
jgi:hypothetical protein